MNHEAKFPTNGELSKNKELGEARMNPAVFGLESKVSLPNS